MEGFKAGRLTVVGFSHRGVNGRLYWNCKCVCGGSRTVSGTRLRTESVGMSCGCAAKERRLSLTHRMSRTPEYRSWIAMMQRCIYPHRDLRSRWGERGIGVCTEWREFEGFYSDMGPRPEGHTLDRVDNNKDYCKENCRWATPKQQARNNSRNAHITVDGVTRILIEWAEATGQAHSTLSWRKQQGWSAREIIYGRRK